MRGLKIGYATRPQWKPAPALSKNTLCNFTLGAVLLRRRRKNYKACSWLITEGDAVPDPPMVLRHYSAAITSCIRFWLGPGWLRTSLTSFVSQNQNMEDGAPSYEAEVKRGCCKYRCHPCPPTPTPEPEGACWGLGPGRSPPAPARAT